jgi:hypothetical protein
MSSYCLRVIWRPLPLSILWFALLGGSGMALEPCDCIPKKYVGKWTGVIGADKSYGESLTRTQTGTAVVVTDFGHTIDCFEFKVDKKGKVTGTGTAIYRFRALSEANVLVGKITGYSDLANKTQKVDFTINGMMSRMGKLKLQAKPTTSTLTLINAGEKREMEAWDVFGGLEAVLEVSEGKFVAETFGVTAIAGKTTKLAWRAERDAPISDDENEDKGATLPPPQPGGNIPKIWVGKWEGNGKQRLKFKSKVGTADVLVDSGAVIDSFEIDVAEDGKVTGKGKATYWFDVSADANLLLARQCPYSRLDKNVQQIDFDIKGTMTAAGKLKLAAAPKKNLKLLNVDKEETIEAWNVFPDSEEAVIQPGLVPRAKVSVNKVEKLMNLSFDWKVKKKALVVRGQLLERVYVPMGGGNNNFVTMSTADWDQIKQQVINPAGTVRIEVSFVDADQAINETQPPDVKDQLTKTETDEHGCFQLQVPTIKGKTLRLRTTYTNKDAKLKEHCFIDVPMDRILEMMDKMQGDDAKEDLKDDIKRQTYVWVRYKKEYKRIDLGKEPRQAQLHRYPGGPFALEFDDLKSIFVNTFILQAPYLNQNTISSLDITGVHVPAKKLMDLMPANSTAQAKDKVRDRIMGPGSTDSVPVDKTTDAKVVGPEICYPCSTFMALGCLHYNVPATVPDIGQGCYDYFYKAKIAQNPSEFPYEKPQHDTTRWPYRDMPQNVTYSDNPKKWLLTCKGGAGRPWQFKEDPPEPYLRAFVKDKYSIDSKKDEINVFNSGSDATVLQNLGSGNPGIVSITHLNYAGDAGGTHIICLLGAIIDKDGKIKRLIFHDPFGDQTQHPDVQGYYDGVGHQMVNGAPQPPQNGAQFDKDDNGTKGQYAPYGNTPNDMKINSAGGSINSNYVVWWLNPATATPENMRPRLLTSSPPSTEKLP